ncbi:hypothetical protein EDEG_02246 [Edhazardia aedis USNM 41457]|uniref:Uncharacterized protein n=1 Tax=Edhazardia aedis (strain USNM 41457) TaxID=1003232 RepID=J9D6K6_EDHAE|nr:hypothetical protein EDEG_02246 [Edhazardia aedis USNM 41457]|eukprot:EJW03426.1 hypothetical protein EDEG_02246 [Edhazardia aedis USNM 41457]
MRVFLFTIYFILNPFSYKIIFVNLLILFQFILYFCGKVAFSSFTIFLFSISLYTSVFYCFTKSSKDLLIRKITLILSCLHLLHILNILQASFKIIEFDKKML